MKALIEYIEMGLEIGKAPYITAVDSDGDKIKIRVRDHSCNDRNNDFRCLSFITNSTERKPGQHANTYEWVMTYDESNECWIDNQYDDIQQILSDFNLVGYYDQFHNFNKF